MDTKRLFARELRKSTTDAERLLWRHLRNRQIDGFRFRRQVPLGPYIADFLCPQAKLIIELDGGQHGEKMEYDPARTAWLLGRGYRVLRFWNHDVLRDIDVVVDEIHRGLMKSFTPPQPSPSRREREGEQPQPSPACRGGSESESR